MAIGVKAQGAEHKARNKRLQSLEHEGARAAWKILTPIVIYYIIFVGIPVLSTFALSLTAWNGIVGLPSWVGLQNLMTFFREPDYLRSLFQTMYIGLSILAIQMVVGLLVALLLNQAVPMRGLFRTLWYIPVVVAFSIVSEMATAFLNPTWGVINTVLKAVGLHPIVWQTSAFWMTLWLIVITAWKSLGGVMIIFLAGLQGIDPSFYEAAGIDGASGIQQLRYITIPLLKPITLFVLITGVIGSFHIFEPVQLITRGGPLNATNVIMYKIYRDAFGDFNIGMAAASSVVVTVISLVLTKFQLRWIKAQ